MKVYVGDMRARGSDPWCQHPLRGSTCLLVTALMCNVCHCIILTSPLSGVILSQLGRAHHLISIITNHL